MLKQNKHFKNWLNDKRKLKSDFLYNSIKNIKLDVENDLKLKFIYDIKNLVVYLPIIQKLVLFLS